MSSSSIFAGNSRYSADFQSIIDRSVAIASLPINQLTDSKTALTNQSKAMADLETKVTALETAVSAVRDALGAGAFAAAVANQQVARATIGTGAMEGTYGIEVLDLGAHSTAMSAGSGIANPGQQSLTPATEFGLRVGSDSYTITPAANNLTALANAINARTEAHVRATVVNVGSEDDPDYRLSLESTRLSGDAIQLDDGTTSLLTGTTGAKARYRVNGVSTEAESSSRTVSIAPGLTVELLATGQTSITVTRQSSVLSSALASLAEAYNAASKEVDKHRGQAGGVLSGQELVLTLSHSLHELAASALGEVGLSLDEHGVMSFDALAFTAADWSNPAGVSQFLNGFVGQASSTLQSLPIQTASDGIQSQIADTDARIAEEQQNVARLKTSLAERMAAADALIAAMEQQYNYLTQMFQSMRDAQGMYQ